MWRLRTGRSWASIPERYGPYMVCHGRFQRWRDTGVWARIVEAASQVYDGELVLIDASAVAVPPCWHSVAVAGRDPVSWIAPIVSGPRDAFSIVGSEYVSARKTLLSRAQGPSHNELA